MGSPLKETTRAAATGSARRRRTSASWTVALGTRMQRARSRAPVRPVKSVARMRNGLAPTRAADFESLVSGRLGHSIVLKFSRHRSRSGLARSPGPVLIAWAAPERARLGFRRRGCRAVVQGFRGAKASLDRHGEHRKRITAALRPSRKQGEALDIVLDTGGTPNTARVRALPGRADYFYTNALYRDALTQGPPTPALEFRQQGDAPVAPSQNVSDETHIFLQSQTFAGGTIKDIAHAIVYGSGDGSLPRFELLPDMLVNPRPRCRFSSTAGRGWTFMWQAASRSAHLMTSVGDINLDAGFADAAGMQTEHDCSVCLPAAAMACKRNRRPFGVRSGAASVWCCVWLRFVAMQWHHAWSRGRNRCRRPLLHSC